MQLDLSKLSPALGLGPSPMGFGPPTNLIRQGLVTDPVAQKKILGSSLAQNAIFSYFTL